MQYSRNLILAMLATVSILLQSCVTTTTGGFVVEASEEQALQDYIQLALGYYNANDMVGARRHVNNALEIDDRTSEIYNVLALILQREGDLELADANFQRAIELDSTNSRARNNYGAFLFSRQRFEDAFEQLNIVANDINYEGRAIAFENLGRAARRLNRIDDAQYAFERAITLNANLYVSALELAEIYADKADWNNAQRLFRQYITIVQFFNIPHTPRALLAGIEIESQFQNDEMVDSYALILSTLYQDSPEYQQYQRFTNANR